MAQSTSPKQTVAELFCGCGGFSLGFERTGRFRTVLGLDIKRYALKTFALNHSVDGATPAAICEDLRTVGFDRIGRVLEDSGVAAQGGLDCLIGGPPCQGFSQLRRSEERQADGIVKFSGYNRSLADPRNALVLRFLEVVAIFQPRSVVIENVPQMLRHSHSGRPGDLAESIRSTLVDLGYSVAVGVLNAADFGVPQLRERAIFLAMREGRPSLPSPTNSASDFGPASTSLPYWVTVHDAIADLPDPPQMEDLLGGGDLSLYGESNSYVERLRSKKAFPFNHVTRSYSGRILDIIRHMKPGETWDSASERMGARYQRQIAKARKRGEREATTRNRLIREGKINKAFYREYYWSAYTRLDWQRPALTITANANFLGSGRFTHPTAQRGITVREAARLQSFPDDFTFVTDDDIQTTNIGVGLDMIGEAVPPALGEAIAAQLLRNEAENSTNTPRVSAAR